MKDVIYRDDAIEAWDKLSKRGRTEFDQVLMTLPPADVVPKHDVEIIIDEITKRTSSTEVEQGEWICKGDDTICSKCGGSSGTQFDGVEPIPRTTAFCPHCGRRMKGAEHEID